MTFFEMRKAKLLTWKGENAFLHVLQSVEGKQKKEL